MTGVLAVVELSIVLITRNQSWNITRLVESALRISQFVPSHEVVLVDSASSDGTVEMACTYPIGVVRLQNHQQLTPAAGRYIGCKYTSGRYVLFLDGDMELCDGWLPKAFELFRADAGVGAVTGKVWDLPIDTGPNTRPEISEVEGTTEIPHSGGAAIYRRDALESVGQFNPYLCSDEEPDLCIRLRQAGYRIVRTAQPIVFHYTEPRRSLSTMLARWNRNLYFGFGQNLRYHFRRPTFKTYLRERGYAFTPGLALVLAGVALWLWTVEGRAELVLTLAAVSTVFIVIATVRKRSFSAVLQILLHRALIFAGTLRGLAMRAPPPETYPVRQEVLKDIQAAESH